MRKTDQKLNTEYIYSRIVKYVGEFGGANSVADPYQLPYSYSDLRTNFGTPPGFKLQAFAVEIKDANDSRLTEDGLKHIAYQLRDAADAWMVSQLKEDRYGLIGCVTPNIFVTVRPASAMEMDSRERLWIAIKVYVYPRLSPTVLTAAEGEALYEIK